MKKIFVNISILLVLLFNLTGCQTIGQKNASLAFIYGVAALLSLILLIGCCVLVRKKRAWFVLLFTSVLVVNIGYAFLSTSTSLEMALWANRVSYLSSVFLPFAMLMILLNVTNLKQPKWLPISLGIIAFIMFLIAASPGFLPIYYKEVSFAVINGTSTLIKVYGPLHPLYLLYLVGYFSAMVTITILSYIKKWISNPLHAIMLTIAVFVNIGVWLIEQLTRIDFEMLSISYIISELFLLGIHLLMNEYQRLNSIVAQVKSVQNYSLNESNSADTMLKKPLDNDTFSPECIEIFISGLKILTPTEKAIYDAYIARVTTKEIMVNMNIKESTLKFHNRNIYGKLGVTSRKELLEVHKHVNSVKTMLVETKS